MPGITIGDTVPNLEVETTHGKFKLHHYFANGWTILFSHPGLFCIFCYFSLSYLFYIIFIMNNNSCFFIFILIAFFFIYYQIYFFFLKKLYFLLDFNLKGRVVIKYFLNGEKNTQYLLRWYVFYIYYELWFKSQ